MRFFRFLNRISGRIESGWIFVFLFGLLLIFPEAIRAKTDKTVLVLHSYHKGLSWDEEIDRGIAAAFSASGLSVDLQTEYMDTKRIIDPVYLVKLYDVYAYKFRNRSFDIVLCSDNNALDFLLKFGEDLFPGTPVIFCGINNFRKELIQKHPLYTGVPEAVDIADTLDVGLKLHPKARYVAVFGDGSPTFHLNKAKLMEILPRYDTVFSFLIYDDPGIDDIEKQVRVLPENSIILLISTLRDEKGNLISFERSAERLTGFAEIPVYGCWNFFLGHGIVGGKLINGYSQGKTAAEMALKVLKGTPVAEIPLVEEIPNRYMFDFAQLTRFQVPLDALPAGSLVINRPDSLYSVNKELFWLTGGGMLALLAVIFFLTANIVHRKRAQEALKETEEKYRSVIRNSLHGIALLQRSPPCFLLVNPAVTEIFGYSAEEILAFSAEEMWVMVHPRDREMVKRHFIDRLAGKNPPTRYTFRALRKDGADRWVEVSASLLEGYAGGIIQAIFMDITDRIKAEKALRESELKFRTLFDASPQGILLTEVDSGRIIDANREFCEATGLNRKEVMGKSAIELGLFTTEDRQRLIGILQERGEVRGLEMTFSLGKRGAIPTLVFTRMVYLENIRFLLSIIVDMRAQKKAQAEKAALQEKLARSKKMEALGLLAGGVAHDLNNILSGIVSYPELLLTNPDLGEKERRALRVIQESGMRAAAVVGDMLTVTRGVASTKQILNPNALIEDYLGSPEFAELKGRHPLIDYRTDLAPDLFNISGSALHLRKSLMNLVINGSEAMTAAGPLVLRTRNRYVDRPLKGYDEVLAGEYVVIEVRDGGSGISPEDLDRIFEPFYTKKVMGRSGTGLGLAVVWNTVQDHGGYINVHSDENGTAFELYLPVSRHRIEEKKAPVPPADYRGNGQRILVVDDEESQREIACEILTTLGYRAEAVSGGKEAVAYVKNHPVDLVVLDMVMAPGIGGRETYAEILNIHPDQKAIIASGFSESEEVHETQRMGAGRYIKKPYTLENIGLAIRETLGERPKR
ncbi:MAG: PAS domain S-box protein [Desulfococcaceae bacterium]